MSGHLDVDGAGAAVARSRTERTPFLTARALAMSDEGLAEPQAQRSSTVKRNVMIPSIDAWRPPLSMRILIGVQRIVSVRALAPPNLIDKKSCERERFTMRINVRGGPMMPPGCCSRFVWSTRSISLLARALMVVCSRGSQQKYCVALSEKSWCGSSVCDEFMSICFSHWPNGSVFIQLASTWTLLRPIGLTRSFIFAISLAVALYVLAAAAAMIVNGPAQPRSFPDLHS